jgi:hypothetical protein
MFQVEVLLINHDIVDEMSILDTFAELPQTEVASFPNATSISFTVVCTVQGPSVELSVVYFYLVRRHLCCQTTS